jgi:dihydrofolate reductase
MGTLIVYIATSLDGFIAGPDDDISWLDQFTGPGEDYGYGEFIRSVGTAIMGARTWEQSLAHPERLLTGLKNYVFTSRSLPATPGTAVEFWHGSLSALVQKIRGESEKDIFLVGGGKGIAGFLQEGLVDEIRQFIVPVILGKGIPLYTGISGSISLTLIDMVSFQTGIVGLRYLPHREPEDEMPGHAPVR